MIVYAFNPNIQGVRGRRIAMSWRPAESTESRTAKATHRNSASTPTPPKVLRYYLMRSCKLYPPTSGNLACEATFVHYSSSPLNLIVTLSSTPQRLSPEDVSEHLLTSLWPHVLYAFQIPQSETPVPSSLPEVITNLSIINLKMHLRPVSSF